MAKSKLAIDTNTKKVDKNSYIDSLILQRERDSDSDWDVDVHMTREEYTPLEQNQKFMYISNGLVIKLFYKRIHFTKNNT